MFPYYLYLGMDYDLYWNGNPRLVKAYRLANEMKIKQRNEELWLQGLYNYNAISTALSNIHLDGKSHKVNKYLEQPIDLFPKNDKQKREEVTKTRNKVIEQLNAWKQSFDRKGK